MTPALNQFCHDLADVLHKHGGSIELSTDEHGKPVIELVGPHEDCIRPGSFIDSTSIRETIALKQQRDAA